MNNDRRKRLEQALDLIEKAEEYFNSAAEIVDEVRDEEQEAFDNMPENFQQGEEGQRMEEIIDVLCDLSIADAIEEARASIFNALE